MPNKTNKITYSVIMMLYDMSRPGAINKLNEIRSTLEIPKGKVLNVLQFCKFEDLTIPEFDEMMKRAFEKL